MEPLPVALETTFNGVRYRSRLEARWALFLKELDINFHYEFEGYRLPDGTCYLPDFYLPTQDIFLEIKPSNPNKEERNKASGLAEISGRMVYIFYGPIECPDSSIFHESSIALFPNGGEDYGYYWCQCPHCFRLDVKFNGRADRISCNCPKSAHGDKGYNSDAPEIVAAFEAAKSFRFW